MQDVAVVILNYNGVAYLKKFLPLLFQHSEGAQIVVVDNASTDDSVSFLKEAFPQVQIVINPKNGGFAQGYNQGLAKVLAKYYVLLNSDVEVTSGWLRPLIETLDKNERVAACQPKLLAYHQRDEFEYAGGAGGFIDKYGYPFCRGRIFNVYEKDTGQYNDACEILWATGACLAIKADVFHLVEGFDEDFFAHMEEIDLCWRIRNLGYSVLYCPTSLVYHVGGGTLNKINPHKTYLNFRNNLILLFKNHASRYFLIKIVWRMLLDGVAAFKFLVGGEADHFAAVFKAHISFYTSIGKTIKKRMHFKRTIKNFNTVGIYRGSILVDFFLKGKRRFSQLDKHKF